MTVIIFFINTSNFSCIFDNSVKHYFILYDISLSPERLTFSTIFFLFFKYVAKKFFILSRPYFPSLSFDINNLKSSTRSSFKKLLDNFIPASIKILQKPNFLASTSDSFKSRFPNLSKEIL